MLAMIIAQAGLGVWTLLSNKAADVATGHVVLGAACLALASMMLMVAKRGAFVAGAAKVVDRLAKCEDAAAVDNSRSATMTA